MMNENVKENFDIEELDDFEVNEEITYLVCALGYNENAGITACEVYLGEFELPDEAIAFAKTVDLAAILQYAVEQDVADLTETAYFSLEVETLVKCDDTEDGTENIDTIWEARIDIG